MLRHLVNCQTESHSSGPDWCLTIASLLSLCVLAWVASANSAPLWFQVKTKNPKTLMFTVRFEQPKNIHIKIYMNFALNPDKTLPWCLGIAVNNTKMEELKVPPPLALHHLNPTEPQTAQASHFLLLEVNPFPLCSSVGHTLDDCRVLADFKNAWVHRHEGISH